MVDWDDPHPFSTLEDHRYMRLTTYRRDGEDVPTPVWFAILDDRIHVFTDNESGKVRRIRKNPRVTLAPATSRTVRAAAASGPPHAS